MKWRIAGFVAGLIIKCSMLFYLGVFDMKAYFEWGQGTLQTGLARYYHGTYFPLQYQIFAFSVWITERLGSDLVFVFKLTNLIFDTIAFFLLVSLLKRQGSNPAYALLYWLHPWFLSVFSLGYIDFQFAALVLLSIWFLREDTLKDYLLSGIALGLAFVMKPQSMILMIAAMLFAICHFARTRNVRATAMVAAPAVFFLGYELFFTASLYPLLGYKAPRVLLLSYRDIAKVFPCLTAQMTNIWYPIAYMLKPASWPIFAVSDQILLLPHLSIRTLAIGIVLTVIAFHVFRTERKAGMTLSDRFIAIFGIASLTVPFLMTSAHENHLFLGTIFLVLFLAKSYPPVFKLACHLLLVIQFLNLYGLYGEHPVWIAHLLTSTYSQKLAVGYSLIAVACFAVILKRLVFTSSARDSAGNTPPSVTVLLPASREASSPSRH
jgi:hypothetical protein